MDGKVEKAIEWIRSVERGEARVASYRGPWAPLMVAVASGACRDTDVMEAIIDACAARAGFQSRAALAGTDGIVTIGGESMTVADALRHIGHWADAK